MEWERASTDLLEQQLVEDERLIGRLRARQMVLLSELDSRQIATADGSRSLSEWTAARMDVAPETARTLVQTMRRLSDRPDLATQLADGDVSFDRIEAVSRVPDDVGLMQWADIGGVHREASKQARITAQAEHRAVSDRFLVLQPSLDESSWRLWGGLDGHSGALVDKVLTEAADTQPTIEGFTPNTSWKRATALVECLTSDDPPPAQVTVIVDAHSATRTDGEAGVVLEPGANVGQQALNAVLCNAITEVTARTEDGRYMDYGRKQRTTPPALKRALLAETGFTCAADGCTSNRRLQIHHIKPWTQGGTTNQNNLIVLCWYHHQIIIHEHKMTIAFCPDRRRIRFKQPNPQPPD